jgi:hypothetical protein
MSCSATPASSDRSGGRLEPGTYHPPGASGGATDFRPPKLRAPNMQDKRPARCDAPILAAETESYCSREVLLKSTERETPQPVDVHQSETRS